MGGMGEQLGRQGVPWMTPRHGKADVAHFFETAGQMEIVDLQMLNPDGGR